ncbi:MAG: YqeG family HAD IIIA-type phosphatase [Bacilli bacterium]|nr:YqeG family HAD IIIA-type phosphatase [Bacilli bacterium]MDD4808708.1 YqeG family HAD IIIA-type phosphatase [Bacilli bacterium]
MEKYIPDRYQKSIYTIDYDNLLKCGITCLLFDLDNTIAPIGIVEPTKKTKELFKKLKEKGFKLVIFSNSNKKRLKPFKEILDVDCCASALKPLSGKFLKVLNEYDLDVSEVAIIGDQILTDVVGGNNVGITTILINPVSTKDFWFTKINRLFEKKIINKLSKRDLFYKGKYYE